MSATLQAFERQGVAHTLAEPTVTAISGESAKFLAGGTVPIVNGEFCNSGNTGCTPTLIQQPYGVTLNFTPVVLSERTDPAANCDQVTDIDPSVQITFAGYCRPRDSAPGAIRPRWNYRPAARSPRPASP